MLVYIKVHEDNDVDPLLRRLAVAGSAQQYIVQQLTLCPMTAHVESDAVIY